MKREVVICFGSNLPDGDNNIRHASESIGSCVAITATSGMYKTDGEGGDESEYFNQVVKGTTLFDYDDLLKKTKEIERLLGRDVSSRESGKVTVDIDIVVYDGVLVRNNDFLKDYFQLGYKRLH